MTKIAYLNFRRCQMQRISYPSRNTQSFPAQTHLLLVQRVLTQHFLACAAARICSAADFTRAAIEKVKIGHSQTTLSLGAVPTIVSRTKPPVVLSIHVQFVRTPTALNKID